MKILLRSAAVALLLTLCCAPALVGCGAGADTSSTDDLAGSRRKCSNDAGCYNGYVCVSGYCQKPGTPPPPPPGCTSNSACSNGQVCVSGTCQACTSTSQCSSGQVCSSGVCQTPTPPPPACSVNTDCKSGQVCVSGVCEACSADSQCASGQVCTSGKCTTPAPPPPPACKANTDCASGQVCVAGVCEACTADSQCGTGLVCTSGKCTTPAPPAGGCATEHDCANGGLCESGACVAMACAHRASTKTGIRTTVLITKYQGMIHGANGDHEVAYGTLGNVEWIHDPSLEDSTKVQLALNVSSSTDPTGLPHEIPVSVGQTIEVEGEYITAASANASGNAVIHFTHSTCGYVTIAGTTYQ